MEVNSSWKDVLHPSSDSGCPGIRTEPHTHYLAYFHCSELNQCAAIFQAKREKDEGKKFIFPPMCTAHFYFTICTFYCICN